MIRLSGRLQRTDDADPELSLTQYNQWVRYHLLPIDFYLISLFVFSQKQYQIKK